MNKNDMNNPNRTDVMNFNYNHPDTMNRHKGNADVMNGIVKIDMNNNPFSSNTENDFLPREEMV